ncbi:MAG: peptidylprolyl isomerase [Phycisphaerales bacterium]|nr:peptidylprolyl isomerase [Phycisphaerales bacterium]
MARVGVVIGLVGLLAAPILRADDPPVALVGGEPISQKELFDLLVKAHGVDSLAQLVLLEVAKAEAARKAVRVTQADIEREYQTSLDKIVRDTGMTVADATPENKRKALNTILEQKRISFSEFMVSMERNAYLRKIVESEQAPVEDSVLREVFARRFGERAHVRHIQLNAGDQSAINNVKSWLDRNDSFEDIARRFSVNEDSARRGGELSPFTYDSEEYPAAFREAAFALKPGDISNPVRIGEMVHILQLIERIPPEATRFEDVRDRVEKEARAQVVQQKMNELLVQLFKGTDVKVLIPELREQYDEYRLRATASLN